MTVDEILNELEAQMSEVFEFQGACFEQVEGFWALADARLTVFRSERLWALVIEAVRYDFGAEEFALSGWCYGNCLKSREELFELSRPLFVMPSAWNEGAETGAYGREGFTLRWRGQIHSFAPSLAELTAAGVRLSRREQESGELTKPQVLRYVCHALDHPFFASEDTLRDLLDNNRFESEWKYEQVGEDNRCWFESPQGDFEDMPILSADLELFLQTRDWCHPRSTGLNFAPEGEISVREAFEPLAKALATGDLSHWQTQDPSRFNSHWRFWAETDAAHEAKLDEIRAALAVEGERFREFIQTLPLAEREEAMRAVKVMWAEKKQDFANSLSIAPSMGGAMLFSSFLQIAEQTFTLGPHLWGENEILLDFFGLNGEDENDAGRRA